MPDLRAQSPLYSGPDLVAIGDESEVDLWARAPLYGSPDLVAYRAGTVAIVTAVVGVITGTAALVASPTLAATGSLSITGTAALTAAPLAASVGALSITGTSALSLAPTLAGVGALSIAGTGALSLAPTLAATGSLSITGTAALTATPVLASTGSLSLSGTGALSLAPSVAASGSLSITGTSALSLPVVLAGDTGFPQPDGNVRSLSLSLPVRSLSPSLPTRSLSLALPTRSLSVALPTRVLSLSLPTRSLVSSRTTLVKGDTETLSFTCTIDSGTIAPSSVALNLYARGVTSTPSATIAGTVASGSGTAIVVVTVAFTPGNTPAAGVYNCELAFTFGGGTTLTWPRSSPNVLLTIEAPGGT